jgi:hypothetical protein
MKRFLKIIGAIVIVLAIPAIIQKVMFRDKPDAKKQALVNLAAEQNASVPKKLDSVTTLTRVEYDDPVWRVHYTLSPAAQIDPYSQAIYRDRAIKEICGGSTRQLLVQKITIEYLYTYTDSAGEQKMRITIPPGSC